MGFEAAILYWHFVDVVCFFVHSGVLVGGCLINKILKMINTITKNMTIQKPLIMLSLVVLIFIVILNLSFKLNMFLINHVPAAFSALWAGGTQEGAELIMTSIGSFYSYSELNLLLFFSLIDFSIALNPSDPGFLFSALVLTGVPSIKKNFFSTTTSTKSNNQSKVEEEKSFDEELTEATNKVFKDMAVVTHLCKLETKGEDRVIQKTTLDILYEKNIE